MRGAFIRTLVYSYQSYFFIRVITGHAPAIESLTPTRTHFPTSLATSIRCQLLSATPSESFVSAPHEDAIKNARENNLHWSQVSCLIELQVQ